MRRRILLLMVWATLLTALVALTPLAYASPPDETWVSGIFDDDDNDNAVYFVTSSTATLDPFPLCGRSPFPVFWPALVSVDREPASPQYFSTVDARAPPIS
jgi:hypothetical protein